MIHNELNLAPVQAPAHGFARVLLIDADPTSRITMRAVLEAGGYGVQQATTSVEAIEMLDSQEFELVVCNPSSSPDQIDEAVLSYARFQSYEPATAVLTTMCCAASSEDDSGPGHQLLVEPQNLPDLLGVIADMVAGRVLSRLERELEGDQRLS